MLKHDVTSNNEEESKNNFEASDSDENTSSGDVEYEDYWQQEAEREKRENAENAEGVIKYFSTSEGRQELLIMFSTVEKFRESLTKFDLSDALSKGLLQANSSAFVKGSPESFEAEVTQLIAFINTPDGQAQFLDKFTNDKEFRYQIHSLSCWENVVEETGWIPVGKAFEEFFGGLQVTENNPEPDMQSQPGVLFALEQYVNSGEPLNVPEVTQPEQTEESTIKMSPSNQFKV